MTVQWKENQVMFRPVDLQVLKRAGARMNEVPDNMEVALNLPPIWSPLSYVLLYEHRRCHSEGTMWRKYRETVAMARRRDAYYEKAFVPKNSGKGVRQLSIPRFDLAQHQKWIYDHILQHLPVSPCACAYRKGVSLRACAQPHLGREVLVRLDIRNFFNSITEQQVTWALHRYTGYRENVAGFLAALCCHRGCLPQGACTSPALSNLVMRRIDSAIQAMAESTGCVYTRYADDIFLSGNIEKPQALIRWVRNTLREGGFVLNEEKTRILHRDGQSMRVAGIVVNEKLQVPREYRRKVRQELHYLFQYGDKARGVWDGGSYETYLLRMLGRVSYILQVNPQDREALQAKERLLQMLP